MKLSIWSHVPISGGSRRMTLRLYSVNATSTSEPRSSSTLTNPEREPFSLSSSSSELHNNHEVNGVDLHGNLQVTCCLQHAQSFEQPGAGLGGFRSSSRHKGH